MLRYSDDKDENKFVHLTNYSVSEKNKNYIANNDPNAHFGHKWFGSNNFYFLL